MYTDYAPFYIVRIDSTAGSANVAHCTPADCPLHSTGASVVRCTRGPSEGPA